MLQFARGKRIRLTCVQTGHTHFAKLGDSDGNVASCWPDGPSPEPGEVVGECFVAESYYMFRAIGGIDEDGLYCLTLDAEPKRIRLGTTIDFAVSKFELKVRSQFARSTARLFAAGPNGLAFESSRSCTQGEQLELEVPEEDRLITLPAIVVATMNRGKSAIVFAQFRDISRVQSMHWNRIVKAE